MGSKNNGESGCRCVKFDRAISNPYHKQSYCYKTARSKGISGCIWLEKIQNTPIGKGVRVEGCDYLRTPDSFVTRLEAKLMEEM